MFIGPNGKSFFSDLGELYYNLFLEIGLGINQDQHIYDQDTGIVLTMRDKFIKASFSNEPIYSGKNDIVFDPASSYNIVVWLLCYYVEKEIANGNDISYLSHFIDDEDPKVGPMVVIKKENNNIIEKYRQRVCIVSRTEKKYTNFYFNLYLAFIEAIFILADNDDYDLSNFDIVPGA